jgi:DnaJ homolog subfamily C member 11
MIILKKKRVHRASQSLMFPIHLSNEIVPSAIFYGTVTPLLAYYVVKKLVIDPYVKNKEETYEFYLNYLFRNYLFKIF